MKQWKFRSRNSKQIKYKNFSKEFHIDSSRNPQINIETYKLDRSNSIHLNKSLIKAQDLETTNETEDLSLVSWGSGKEGSLGNGKFEDSEKIMNVLNFSKVNIIEILCGAGNTIVLSSENCLYSWGLNSVGQLGLGHFKNRNSPCYINFNFGKICKIACGAGHCMVINENGELFSWGCAGFYQTGHGKLTHSPLPEQVEYFKGKNVIDAACGISHSLVIADNKVFAFGDNLHSQCTGNGIYYQVPIQLQLENIVKVAAGGGHSLFLSNRGIILACGLNSCGQIGVICKELIREPIELKISNAANIYAGEEVSACLTANSKVYVWGWNGFGQLSQEHFADIMMPTIIEIEEEIDKVSLGVSALGLITKSKKLFISGHIGQCLKSQLKKNQISLDIELSKSKHLLTDATISCIGIGRTHCVLFIEKIIKIAHNISFEATDPNKCICFIGGKSSLQIDSNEEPSMPEFNIENTASDKNASKYKIPQEELLCEIKLPQIQRELSIDMTQKVRKNYENPFKILLSFQKAKEEARALVKDFKLYEKHPLTTKPLSEDRLTNLEPRKMKKMKSFEREISQNFLPNLQQPHPNHQQRINDLESLIAKYDRKISKYSEIQSPKVNNFKMLKRIGGGYIGKKLI